MNAVALSKQPDPATLTAAFEALKTYSQGSSRALLLPIDHAVSASLDGKATRLKLERRLVAALQSGGPVAASEYIISKLSVLGSKSCVSVLEPFLKHPVLDTAARNALEAIPDTSATRILRDSLGKVEGLQKVGVINSLRARRDPGSIRVLTVLMQEADFAVAGAAVAALGDIATSKAAKALLGFQSKSPKELRTKFADAMLNCAERLSVAGRKADARGLYASLTGSDQPRHVQQAASHGLRRLAAAK